MKTTLDLPDDLVRAVRSAPSKITEGGLAQEGSVPASIRRRAQLPLVECAHQARPDEEMTPERVTQVLLEEEAAAHRGPLR
jgi:hypothetical protein